MRGTVLWGCGCGRIGSVRARGAPPIGGLEGAVIQVDRPRGDDHRRSPLRLYAPTRGTYMKPAPPVMRMFLGVYSCCWLAMVAVCVEGVSWGRIGKRGVVQKW